MPHADEWSAGPVMWCAAAHARFECRSRVSWGQVLKGAVELARLRRRKYIYQLEPFDSGVRRRRHVRSTARSRATRLGGGARWSTPVPIGRRMNGNDRVAGPTGLPFSKADGRVPPAGGGELCCTGR